MNRIKRTIGAVLLGTFALNGCFTYRSVPPAAVPAQGTPVQVQLSRAMDFPIRDVTVRDVAVITGEVVSASADSLRLSAYRLRSVTGYTVEASGETVTVPRELVVGIEQRTLSSSRSGILALGVLALGFAFGSLGGFWNGEGDLPPPVEPK
jgi:hypothetical protein